MIKYLKELKKFLKYKVEMLKMNNFKESLERIQTLKKKGRVA